MDENSQTDQGRSNSGGIGKPNFAVSGNPRTNHAKQNTQPIPKIKAQQAASESAKKAAENAAQVKAAKEAAESGPISLPTVSPSSQPSVLPVPNLQPKPTRQTSARPSVAAAVRAQRAGTAASEKAPSKKKQAKTAAKSADRQRAAERPHVNQKRVVKKPAVTRAAAPEPTHSRSRHAASEKQDTGSLFSGWRLGSLIAAIASAACLVFAITTVQHEMPVIEEAPQYVPDKLLPSYITQDMLEAAVAMQDTFGHPAGATIAQVILESGQGHKLSELAAQNHNLFGIKYSDSFAHEPEVTGKANWSTEEEYAGERVVLEGEFATFTSDAACITFRSRYFLQAGRYADNPYIAKAIQDHDSHAMAQGLADAGWATASTYAEALNQVIDEYDLTRLDRMTLADFQGR